MTPRLAALVRKELIRPDRPQLVGEDGFRFRHILIRDAAYDALPKATRADLHQRFATWLEEHGDRARRAGRDPRLPPRAGLPLPRRARHARRRRSGRGGAATADRRRPPRAPSARTTAPPSACSSAPPRSWLPAELDLVLESELIDALFWAGDGRRRAAARGLPRRACVCGGRSRRRALREDPGGACSASPSSRRAPRSSCPRSSRRRCRCSRRPATTWRSTSPTPRLRRWRARAGRWGQGWRPYERGLAHARQAGHLPPHSSAARAYSRFFGTTPVSELLAWLDENEPAAGRDHWLRAYRAGALAMLGRFAEARAILAEARAELAERGGGVDAREHHRIRPVGSSSGRTIPPPQPSSEQQGSDCSRSWGNSASCRPRPGIWRRRSTRSIGSTRPTPGQPARSSSARATTR